MVAMMVLAMGMAVVYSFASWTIRQKRYAHIHFIATDIANNRIEHAKSVHFANLPDLTENGVNVDDIGVPDANGAYVRATQIVPTWGGNPDLALITVSVEYPHPLRYDGQPGTNTLSTLLIR